MTYPEGAVRDSERPPWGGGYRKKKYNVFDGRKAFIRHIQKSRGIDFDELRFFSVCRIESCKCAAQCY